MGYDLLIHNGMAVTGDPRTGLLDDAIVGVKDGRIEMLERKQEDGSLPEAGRVIDADGGIVMPGLVNTHTHLPMTLFRGLADDLPLHDWLNNHIFPAEAAYVNAVTVKYGALLACAEMILSGTTTCCDGYFFEAQVAEAVVQSGLRAILGHGVIDHPAPGVPDPSKNIQTAVDFAESWLNASPRITPSIFCHSPYTCSSDTLKKAKAAAERHGLLFQIHVAETRMEYEQSLNIHGVTPIAYLDRIGILDSKTLLVHAIWLTDSDIELIARRQARVSVTTESEMKLASGIAPLAKLLAATIPVGLGTDGSASNNDLDLFREMDMTAKLHKVHSLDPTVMDAQTVFTLATCGGAEALVLDGKIGSLEPGKLADLIVLDVNWPHMFPLYQPISQLVYSAGGADVRDVIIDGKVVLRDRKLLTIDLAGLYGELKEVCTSIKKGKRLL